MALGPAPVDYGVAYPEGGGAKALLGSLSLGPF
jgi:hypothetical protein